jgi:ABC-type antimicrobial peptide transport system permease subunit
MVYRTMLVVLETAGDPRSAVPAVRAQVGQVDKDLALASIRTLEDRVDENVWRHRLAAGALGGLGIGALVMALLGVFAATNQLVNRRIHEMGVRIALGAHPRSIVRLVVSETGRLVLLGVVFGVGGALLAAGAVSSLLYGVGGSDVPTLAGTSLGLVAVALLASYWPARRAGRVDPLLLLRPE